MRYINDDKNEKLVKVREGNFDDVNVSADVENSRYIVEMPNSYDVYWKFNSKDDNFPFAERLHSENPKVALFAVNLNNLSDEKQIKNFNYRVNEARTINREIKAEKQEFESALKIDLAKEGKSVAFLYKIPQRGFSVGDVVKTGKYFVAQAAGESEDKIFIRIFNSSRFLEGKEFADREKVLSENLPIGVPKYFRFSDKNQISVGEYKQKDKKDETKIVDIKDKAEEKAKEIEKIVESKSSKTKKAKTVKAA